MRDIYDAVIRAIEDGESLSAACRRLRIPRRSFYDALDAAATGAASDPTSLAYRYARACERRADKLADELEVAALPVPGEDSASVQARRLYVDTLRWTAAKLRPARYGDYAGRGPDVRISVGELHLAALQAHTGAGAGVDPVAVDRGGAPLALPPGDDTPAPAPAPAPARARKRKRTRKQPRKSPPPSNNKGTPEECTPPSLPPLGLGVSEKNLGD
jgi:hypothetical protein